MKKDPDNRIERAPIVVIMGHIDHGKSTLLDHIRKTNITETEAGGITQHISSYEVAHVDESKKERKITFLDTPGHEAFKTMRSRGAQVADIAILIVSAEDGVKEQTREALHSITEAGVPFIIAINKIDKPGASLDRTKASLIENGIYIEGSGGDIPWVAVSAKTGEGVPELLDLLILVADLETLSGDASIPAEGVVIESNVDTKKGVSAVLIIKNGVLKKGMYIVADDCIAPVRIMEDFLGKSISEASFSSPVRITGFNKVPYVGSSFTSCNTKRDAEKKASSHITKRGDAKQNGSVENGDEEEDITVIPIVIKTDVLGTVDAVRHEIEKIAVPEHAEVRIIHTGAGSISEGDVKAAGGKNHAILLGFNVDVDASARGAAERAGIEIKTSTIIYELAEWLKEAIQKRIPKIETVETTGRAKVLKQFSKTKKRQVLGGRMETGLIALGDQVRVLRRDEQIGVGKVTNLQTVKTSVKEVRKGNEFGTEVESAAEILPGDILESFSITLK